MELPRVGMAAALPAMSILNTGFCLLLWIAAMTTGGQVWFIGFAVYGSIRGDILRGAQPYPGWGLYTTAVVAVLCSCFNVVANTISAVWSSSPEVQQWLWVTLKPLWSLSGVFQWSTEKMPVWMAVLRTTAIPLLLSCYGALLWRRCGTAVDRAITRQRGRLTAGVHFCGEMMALPFGWTAAWMGPRCWTGLVVDALTTLLCLMLAFTCEHRRHRRRWYSWCYTMTRLLYIGIAVVLCITQNVLLERWTDRDRFLCEWMGCCTMAQNEEGGRQLLLFLGVVMAMSVMTVLGAVPLSSIEGVRERESEALLTTPLDRDRKNGGRSNSSDGGAVGSSPGVEDVRLCSGAAMVPVIHWSIWGSLYLCLIAWLVLMGILTYAVLLPCGSSVCIMLLFIAGVLCSVARVHPRQRSNTLLHFIAATAVVFLAWSSTAQYAALLLSAHLTPVWRSILLPADAEGNPMLLLLLQIVVQRAIILLGGCCVCHLTATRAGSRWEARPLIPQPLTESERESAEASAAASTATTDSCFSRQQMWLKEELEKAGGEAVQTSHVFARCVGRSPLSAELAALVATALLENEVVSVEHCLPPLTRCRAILSGAQQMLYYTVLEPLTSGIIIGALLVIGTSANSMNLFHIVCLLLSLIYSSIGSSQMVYDAARTIPVLLVAMLLMARIVLNVVERRRLFSFMDHQSIQVVAQPMGWHTLQGRESYLYIGSEAALLLVCFSRPPQYFNWTAVLRRLNYRCALHRYSSSLWYAMSLVCFLWLLLALPRSFCVLVFALLVFCTIVTANYKCRILRRVLQRYLLCGYCGVVLTCMLLFDFEQVQPHVYRWLRWLRCPVGEEEQCAIDIGLPPAGASWLTPRVAPWWGMLLLLTSLSKLPSALSRLALDERHTSTIFLFMSQAVPLLIELFWRFVSLLQWVLMVAAAVDTPSLFTAVYFLSSLMAVPQSVLLCCSLTHASLQCLFQWWCCPSWLTSTVEILHQPLPWWLGLSRVPRRDASTWSVAGAPLQMALVFSLKALLDDRAKARPMQGRWQMGLRWTGYTVYMVLLFLMLRMSQRSCIGLVVGGLIVGAWCMGRNGWHLGCWSSWILQCISAALVGCIYGLHSWLQAPQTRLPMSNDLVEWLLGLHSDLPALCWSGAFLCMWMRVCREQGRHRYSIPERVVVEGTDDHPVDGADDLHVSWEALSSGASISLIDMVQSAYCQDALLPHDMASLPLSTLRTILRMDAEDCSGGNVPFLLHLLRSIRPVALMSFMVSAMGPPSFLHTLLLVSSLLQAAYAEELCFSFWRWWRPLCLTYGALPALLFAAYIPPVSKWLSTHAMFCRVVGLPVADEPMEADAINLCWVALLTALLLQSQVVNSLRYRYLLLELRAAVDRRQEKHHLLRMELQRKTSEAIQEAAAYDESILAYLSAVRHGARGNRPYGEPRMGLHIHIPGEVEEAEGPAEADEETHSAASHPPVPASTATASEISTPSSLQVLLWIRRASIFLAAYTYSPEAFAAGASSSTSFSIGPALVQLGRVMLQVAVRQTNLLVFSCALFNVMLTGCVWEMVSLFYIVVVALAYYPFAPRCVYQLLIAFVVLGILAKEVAYTIGRYTDYQLAQYISRVLLPPTPGVDVGAGIRLEYRYIFMDFVFYSVLLLHQQVCISNGVYGSAEPYTYGTDGKHYTEADEGLTPSAASPRNAAVADGQYGQVAWVSSPPNPSRQTVCGTRTPQRWAAGLRAYYANLMHVPGVGQDWYLSYTALDFVALVMLVLCYGQMTGNESTTFQDNVQNSVLPGPMALMMCASVVQMVVDRMLYMTRSMPLKAISNVACAICYSILYLYWRRHVVVASSLSGNMLFSLKMLSLVISVQQVCHGYPRYRCPFSFTSYHNTLWQYSCYATYRAVPFLWEMRTLIDWTVQRTSLNFFAYLIMEDVKDMVYHCQVMFYSNRHGTAKLGAPISRWVKCGAGWSRLLLILVALLGPLLYYSTYNPTSTPNAAVQLKYDLSFMGAHSLFTATVYENVSVPVDWPLWLARTRPSLASHGLLNNGQTAQLMGVSTCSNNLWHVSPQALSQIYNGLRGAAANQSQFYILQTLELTRSSNVATSTARWAVPWDAAEGLLRVLDDESSAVQPDNNATTSVKLPLFFTPFVFNHASRVEEYTGGTDHLARNRQSCVLELRHGRDAVLQTLVRYWCLSCAPLFPSGQVPTLNTSDAAEWHCLTTGEGCSQINYEDIDYFANSSSSAISLVPLYFVVLSDSVVVGVAFLRSIGIVALYTTFILALGRLLRSLLSNKVGTLFFTTMVDSTVLVRLMSCAELARAYGDLRLEHVAYLELVDLMRSPERLMAMTGTLRDSYDYGDDELLPQSPALWQGMPHPPSVPLRRRFPS